MDILNNINRALCVKNAIKRDPFEFELTPQTCQIVWALSKLIIAFRIACTAALLLTLKGRYDRAVFCLWSNDGKSLGCVTTTVRRFRHPQRYKKKLAPTGTCTLSSKGQDEELKATTAVSAAVVTVTQSCQWGLWWVLFKLEMQNTRK